MEAGLSRFTIHFATINTSNIPFNIIFSSIFTIHFATINTGIFDEFGVEIFVFTIHFATINTNIGKMVSIAEINLQYTLLLLILFFSPVTQKFVSNLQYTLLLLIQNYWLKIAGGEFNLQYTLLLLILKRNILKNGGVGVFTIHFATINTMKL